MQHISGGEGAGSYRGLQAGVGDVAADRHVLVVFAAVEWNLSEGAVHDGPLPAGALNAVHVDGTRTYNRGSETCYSRMFYGAISQMQAQQHAHVHKGNISKRHYSMGYYMYATINIFKKKAIHASD